MSRKNTHTSILLACVLVHWGQCIPSRVLSELARAHQCGCFCVSWTPTNRTFLFSHISGDLNWLVFEMHCHDSIHPALITRRALHFQIFPVEVMRLQVKISI